jgi:acetyl-CoA carboxylase beta subunit
MLNRLAQEQLPYYDFTNPTTGGVTAVFPRRRSSPEPRALIGRGPTRDPADDPAGPPEGFQRSEFCSSIMTDMITAR